MELVLTGRMWSVQEAAAWGMRASSVLVVTFSFRLLYWDVVDHFLSEARPYTLVSVLLRHFTSCAITVFLSSPRKPTFHSHPVHHVHVHVHDHIRILHVSNIDL